MAEETALGKTLQVEDLTEEHNIRQVQDAIWNTISKMTDEYRIDGTIDGEVFNNSEQAYAYARVQAYRIARQKTGKKLPEK